MRHFLAAASAVTLLAAPAALAQRAPITQGVTSGDLATANAQLRQANAEMRVEINDLKSDMAELNGEVETLEFLLSQTRDEMNAMRDDDRQLSQLITSLEDKITALEDQLSGYQPQSYATEDLSTGPRSLTADSAEDSGPRSLTSASSPAESSEDGSLGTISASQLPGGAGELFADAKSKLLKYDYAGAEASFRVFLENFDSDPQAGEAQYWLGEVLYQQEAYAESGQAYTDMIRNYPDDPRAPDALVKLSRSMRLVGNPDAACAALSQLPKRYPEASGVTKNLAAVERSRSGCS